MVTVMIWSAAVCLWSGLLLLLAPLDPAHALVFRRRVLTLIFSFGLIYLALWATFYVNRIA